MQKFKYDLHMHSCLSPCGDGDMTPNNMVNMSMLNGCDIIAITDHNTALNCPAAMKVGKEAGVLVIPGMELCTSEEAHVVCLFETLEGALDFDSYVMKNTPNIKNRPDIFGSQLILNEEDEEIGSIEKLLITSSFIGVDEVYELVHKYGGTAFPAHVDKSSYSVTASLGVIPDEAGFKAVEITRNADINKLYLTNPEIMGKIILTDSDSHYLESMSETFPWIELPEKSASALIAALDKKIRVKFSSFGEYIIGE